MTVLQYINNTLMKKLLLLFFMPLVLSAQTYTPGQSYFGANQYIEYIAGNCPVIISAPHGGYLTPASIPNRTCQGATTVADAYTEELTREIAQEFFKYTGKYPHVIINRLDRVKLDANREINEATCGNAIAITAWNEFHNFIQVAKNQVNNTYGKGFYVDVHGHSHRKERVELGYMLYDSELRLSDATLNTSKYIDFSSVKSLATVNPNNYTHAAILRGSMSLGSLLNNQGYPAVPSSTIPAPKSGDPYFSGGYNVDTHGSRKGGKIDGVQMECNRTGIRDNVTNRLAFAKKFAVVLNNYVEHHYQIAIRGVITRIMEEEMEAFGLYPNPAAHEVNITLPVQYTSGMLSVYNAQGKLCLQQAIYNQQCTVSISHLPPGVYLAEMKGEGWRYTHKLVKE
jgi:N-formylglutamate amidohydrolase